ncbi:MAG: hypothetical protein H6735_00595 [Alphaproteobacteria bacterium]|nr:hypothetical protein [Alphaproteobacteria bacterium]
MALLAVNQAGQESGVPVMAALGDLPLLQDTVEVDAWGAWGATWRDVVILDGDNLVVGVYNLTSHDLNDPANYAELEAMLLSAR